MCIQKKNKNEYSFLNMHTQSSVVINAKFKLSKGFVKLYKMQVFLYIVFARTQGIPNVLLLVPLEGQCLVFTE